MDGRGTGDRLGSATVCAATVIAVLFSIGARKAVAEELLGRPEIVISGVQAPYDSLAEERVLTREEISRAPSRSLDDILRSVPGFQLFRRQSSSVSHPTAQGASLRGTGPSGSSRAIVLLDGVPINNPFGGWVDWQSVPSILIDSARVQQGFGARHFSNIGLGGVVDLESAAPRGGAPIRAEVAGGSLDTVTGGALVRGESGAVSGALAAEGFRTGGYKIVSIDDRGVIDTDAASRHGSFYGRADAMITSDSQVSVSIGSFDEGRSNGTPYTDNESSIRRLTVRGLHRLDTARFIRANVFAVTADFRSTFSSQNEERSSEHPALDQFDVPAQEAGFSAALTALTDGKNATELGADALFRSGETNERFRFVAGDFTRQREASGEQLSTGAYLFGRRSLARGADTFFFLRAGAWIDGNLERVESEGASGEVVRDERTGENARLLVEPRLQVSYAPDSQSELRLVGARGLRRPTLNELVRPFRVRNDVTEANMRLKTEDAWFVDGSLERKVTPGMTLRASLFATFVEDPIVNATVGARPGEVTPCGFVPEGGVCRVRDNAARSRTTGAQAEIEAALSDSLSMRLSYLYQDGRIDDPTRPEIDDRRLPQQPANLFITGLTYRDDQATATLEARYTGRQPEDDRGMLVLPDVTVVDGRFAYQVADGVELFVSAENLLDQEIVVGKSADAVESIGEPLIVLVGFRTGD